MRSPGTNSLTPLELLLYHDAVLDYLGWYDPTSASTGYIVRV